VTRAKKLLIVVGNTQVLDADEFWGQLVDHCRRHNAIANWDPNADTTTNGDENELTSQLDKMRMADRGRADELVEINSRACGAVSSIEDPEWNMQR